MLNDGINYPPTDPAQPSAMGKKHLIELIDDVGKFPASAIGKFGLYTLMAALEAFTLKSAGKAVARKLCAQTVVRQAEKVALAEATKLASTKALGKLTKFWAKFGKARLVISTTGGIALPMKVKWDVNGDTWETWFPVVGTMTIAGKALDQEFTQYFKSDEVKKALQAQVDMIDAEQKKAQDDVKAKSEDTAKREKQNVELTDKIKKWKTELAKIDAALKKLGGGNTCSCLTDGLDPITITDPITGIATPTTLVTLSVATVLLDTRLADPVTIDPASGTTSDPTTDPGDDVDYDSWTLDELLAGIDLGDVSSSEIVIRDQFFECDPDDECAAL
jgi:RNA polymerase-binding transcription factor DksA